MGHNAAFGADHAGATLRRLDRARLANGGAEGTGEGAGNSADATPGARPARPRAQDADGTGQNSAGEGGAGRWVLWGLAGLAFIGASAGAAWWGFSDMRGTAALVPASDQTAAGNAPAASWADGYQDVYLSGMAHMHTTRAAQRRSLPSDDGTELLGEIEAGMDVTGRLVRGRDTTTRWLQLESGGYIWDGQLAHGPAPHRAEPMDDMLAAPRTGYDETAQGYFDEPAEREERAPPRPTPRADDGAVPEIDKEQSDGMSDAERDKRAAMEGGGGALLVDGGRAWPCQSKIRC